MNCSQFLQIQKRPWAVGAWLFSLAPVMAQTPSASQTNYPTVHIKDKPLEYRQFERVEITGSSIVRKEQTQVLPVISITRDELRRAGIKTVTEAIQSLPSMGNFAEAAQVEIVGGGYANAVIHGIPNGTLVLLNGRRLAPFGRQTMAGPERSGYDLNTLPLADVERIEVLTDGASSLYGTDAIAGVVNIILRNERKGVEIAVDQLQASNRGGQGLQTTLGWGMGTLAKDGYAFLVSAELGRRDALKSITRPESAPGLHFFSHRGESYAANGSWVLDTTAPATLLSPANGNRPRLWVNEQFQNGICPTGSVPTAGQSACRYNQYLNADIYPRQESKRLRARAEWMAFDQSTVFAELIYGQHVDESATRPWPAVSRAVSSDPNSPDYLLAQAYGLNPAGTTLRWRPDLPLLQAVRAQENASLAFGLKGQWQEWDYRLQAYRSQASASRIFETASYAGLSSMTTAHLLRPLDALNPLIFDLQTLRGNKVEMDRGQTTLDALEWRSSRPLFEIHGKDVALGVGLDARRESTNFLNVSGASTVQPSFKANRSVLAGYGELQIPFTPNWDFNTSLRHDQYSDVGGTTNGKLSTRWAITNRWAIRGSLGTGFRAPVVGQTHREGEGFPFAQTAFVNPCTPELAAMEQSLRTLAGVRGHCESTNMVVYSNGNPALKPEKSNQATLGLAFTPKVNLRLSVDYWRVDVTDKIRYVSDNAAVVGPLNPVYFRLDPTGKLALNLPMVNLGEVHKSGLDIEARWRQPTDWGRVQVMAQGTYMLRSEQRNQAQEAYTSDLGRYSNQSDTVVPRLRGQLMLSLNRSEWDTHFLFKYTSSYTDADVRALNLNTGQFENISGRKVEAFKTVDWMLQHHWSKQLTARLRISNLLNTRAPLSFSQTALQVYGANTIYSQLWGRVVELGLTAKF